MSQREQVLRTIRAALATSGAQASSRANAAVEVARRLSAPARHTPVSVGKDPLQRLLKEMDDVQIAVTRLQTRADIPHAVEQCLSDFGTHAEQGVVVASAELDDIDWPADVLRGGARDALEVGRQRGGSSELTSVTACLCAVAETGSVVCKSAPSHAATLNFLPDNHIVVLHVDQVVAQIDDVWQRLRELSVQPRAVNFLTGPSRTADIEQTLELGAHGPRRMQVLLVAASSTDTGNTAVGKKPASRANE